MKKTVVLGLGVSGRAVVMLLQKQGHRVIGVDRQSSLISDPSLEGLEIYSEQAQLPWKEIERLIVSPGISLQHPLLVQARTQGIEILGEVEFALRHSLLMQARAQGVEVLGEAEFALRHLQQRMVAITGTNGKTTVTLLVEHILNGAGIRAKALGNVGTPLTSYLLSPDPAEVIVVELSSYQLETMTVRSFEAGILLNITPDHLERHGDMAAYAQAKCRLQRCLKEGAPFYVQAQVAEEWGQGLRPGYKTYGASPKAEYQTDKVVAKYRESIEYFLPIGYRDLGKHERENVLAAWLLCKSFQISAAQFCRGVETFKKPPHRIEYVSTIDGVLFYDDSKGTNLDAVVQAVQAMRGPVVLIVGGVDKGASYLLWKELLQGKVKRMIALGQAAPKIYRELSPYFNVELTETLTSAVALALRDALPGDHVLLSPGCASYDMFRDYVHRGEEFQKAVKTLVRQGGEQS